MLLSEERRRILGIGAQHMAKWFPPVNWIDLTIFAVLALFGLRGYFRGFFREVFSLLGLVAGFMIAVRYDEPVAELGRAYWTLSPLLIQGVAFVAIFFIVYFLLNLAGWLLHKSEKVVFLKTLNRLGGIAVGIGKGAAVAGLILSSLSSTSWIPQSARENLRGAYLVSPLSNLASGVIRISKEKLFPNERSET